MAQSNRCAAQCKEELFENWHPITVQELCANMGFRILMGIVRLLRFDDYWRKDAMYHYSSVASRITPDHFRELQKYLHFTSSSTLAAPQTPGYDKLGKIRLIVTMFGDQFAAACSTAKDVSNDESMIPFKGRSSLKQCLPLKPIKQGIKI